MYVVCTFTAFYFLRAVYIRNPFALKEISIKRTDWLLFIQQFTPRTKTVNTFSSSTYLDYINLHFST